MNYNKIYENLIKKAQNRNLKEYTEEHHIIPRCLNGSNDKSNLVLLTPEEHYLAHQLLIRIYPNNKKLINAALMMIPNRPNNKLYGWVRRRYAKIMSERQSGKGNINFGMIWISDIINKKSMRVPKTDDLPVGWIVGRNAWNNLFRKCKMCRKEFSVKERKGYFCSAECKTKLSIKTYKEKKYKNGYAVEVDGIKFESISKAGDFYRIGHETARMRFKSPNFPTWIIK